LAGGNALALAGFYCLHDIAAAFEHVIEQFEFEVGEVPVLPVFETLSEFRFAGPPAS